MSHSAKRLRYLELIKISELKYSLANADLSRSRSDEMKAVAQIEAIKVARRRFQETRFLNDLVSPAQIVCESQWSKWATAEEARKKSELAKARAKFLHDVAKLKKALGRVEAARAIQKASYTPKSISKI